MEESGLLVLMRFVDSETFVPCNFTTFFSQAKQLNLTLGDIICLILYTVEHPSTKSHSVYHQLNYHLSSCNKDTNKQVGVYKDFLEASLRKMRPYTGKLYRGIPECTDKEIDDFFDLKCFTSCSKDYNVAANFACREGDCNGFVLNIANGKSYSLGNFSVFDDENESLILPPAHFERDDDSTIVGSPIHTTYGMTVTNVAVNLYFDEEKLTESDATEKIKLATK